MTQVLRPVPTFEQVIRLPDPVIPHPYREIEVSRPDMNVFLQHEMALKNSQTAVHNHITYAQETRQAAAESGVPRHLIEALTTAAASMTNSSQLHGRQMELVSGSLGEAANKMGEMADTLAQSSGGPPPPPKAPKFDFRKI